MSEALLDYLKDKSFHKFAITNGPDFCSLIHDNKNKLPSLQY